MNQSYSSHLFLLVLLSIFVFLFTYVNCSRNDKNNFNRFEPILYPKSYVTTEYLHDLFGENLGNQNDDDDKNDVEDIKIYIRELNKPFPDRRSFHAMRGKRRAIPT